MTEAVDEEIAVPSVAELTEQFSAGTLLQSLFGPYARSWGREDEIVRAIADAHNAGAINILSILTQEALAEIGQSGFFGGQQLYCKMIPMLDAPAQEIVEGVLALIEKGGADGAAGFPANALEDWCRAENTRPAAMLELIDSSDAQAARFLPLTLYAGSYVDRAAFLARAHEAVSYGPVDLRCGAIGALDRIDPQTDSEWSNLMATIENAIAEGDDDLTAAALGAIRIRIGAEVGNRYEALEDLIIRATDRALEPQALHRCAEMLWLEASKLSEPTKATMLSALQNVDPANRATIDLLDYALARYPTIQSDYRDLLNHPRERTEKYREDQTAESTLLPLLALWARGVSATDAEQAIVSFTRDFGPHCNCQLWLPDEDSEAQLYSGDDRHGAMLTGLPVASDLTKAIETIKAESAATQHLEKLSSIAFGHWPIVLMACRHYRLPVPPQLWMGLLDGLEQGIGGPAAAESSPADE